MADSDYDVAVVGGGSTYTPELIEGFARRSGVLAVDELVLHDISADRLDIVGGLARRILARQEFPGRLVTTTSLESAVDGAVAVLVQLRVGGQQARLVDETLPGRFGLLGQETTGPGGFAKALGEPYRALLATLCRDLTWDVGQDWDRMISLGPPDVEEGLEGALHYGARSCSAVLEC